MTWTTPRTWSTGELVTASLLNTHLRDNLDALKNPPSDSYLANESANYTTTSTSFVDVDATNLVFTLDTGGGDVQVAFNGVVGGNGTVYFDVEVDGVRFAGDDGITRTINGSTHALSFIILVEGLAAGSHTFKLQWKVSASTGTLYAGAGTANFDVHPQFWAREVS